MAECVGFFGKRFGHKYTAVYDRDQSFNGDMEQLEKMVSRENPHTMLCPISGDDLVNILGQLSTNKSTYVQHVCVRCGDVVKRQAV